jgi:hypothetical protein
LLLFKETGGIDMKKLILMAMVMGLILGLTAWPVLAKNPSVSEGYGVKDGCFTISDEYKINDNSSWELGAIVDFFNLVDGCDAADIHTERCPDAHYEIFENNQMFLGVGGDYLLMTNNDKLNCYVGVGLYVFGKRTISYSNYEYYTEKSKGYVTIPGSYGVRYKTGNTEFGLGYHSLRGVNLRVYRRFD